MSSATQRSGIGVFGGTFDPVHFGHLRAAHEVREILGLADFRLVPAGQPPHRDPPLATPQQRLAMLRRAVGPVPGISVDDREVRRSGWSYMVDTLGEMRAEAGSAPIVLVVGQDAANHLDGWHRWKSLFELAHLAVMRRPGAVFGWHGELKRSMEQRLVNDPAPLRSRPAGRVLLLDVTQLAISSTDIRRQLQAGRSPRFLLPDSVLDYIREQRLYFAGPAATG
jgi:nicotinate-nucleotide adenylyltransferase